MTWTADELGVAGGSGTSASITLSAAPSSGDLVVAFLNYNSDSGSITPSQSWDGSDTRVPTSETTQHGYWYKEAGGSEPSTYTFTLGTSTSWQLHVAVFTATDTPSFVAAYSADETHANQDDLVCGAADGVSMTSGELGIMSGGFDNRSALSAVYDTADQSFTAGIGSTYGEDANQLMGFAYRIFSTSPTITGNVTLNPSVACANDTRTFSWYLVFEETVGGGGGSVFRGLTLLGIGS